jgi:hypothetical protein
MNAALLSHPVFRIFSTIRTFFSFGNALQTSSGSDFVSFASGLTALNNTQKFSFHLWINKSKGDFATMGSQASPQNRIALNFFTDDNLYVAVSNGNGSYGVLDFTPYLDSYACVSLCYDGTATGNSNRLKCYINNVLQNLNYPNGNVPDILSSSIANGFEINRGAGTLIGVVKYEEMVVTTDSSTLAQHQAFYNSNNGALATDCFTNILAYWRCNQVDGDTTLIDSVGTATGTLNNFVAPYFIPFVNPVSYISATGGTITTDGDYKVHTFNSSSTFTVVSIGSGSVDSAAVDAIIIAGGGGGGGFGGGGSGGYLNTTLHPVSVLSYAITIGASGAGSVNGSSKGSHGSDSIFNIFRSTAGGGGGAFSDLNLDGVDGGSGGGGGTKSSSPFTNGEGGKGNVPSRTPSQGNGGGFGASGNSATAAGGGGGHQSNGVDATLNTGGSGGNGTLSSINGSAVSRAGGGGGGGRYTQGLGTSGGGNGNQSSPSRPSTSGTVNTGGGGGGGYNTSGSAGGSGVVVIRYKFQ